MKALLSTLLMFSSMAIYGQKMPADYFEEANSYFENKNFEEALRSFQYIVDNHRKNELFPKAFYNVGYINFVQKKYDEAIAVFQEILESDFDEKEDLGGSVMADPYTNYRHRASAILSDIYYLKKKYDNALHYFALSDTLYPYFHFCGNEYASYEVYTSLRYADIYQKLGLPEKAIEHLLPSVFIQLADNSDIIEELRKLMKGRKGLKQELDNSLSQIYSKKFGDANNEYIKYYFIFLNVEIAVPDNYNEKKRFDKEKALNEIKQSKFYNMIEQL